MSIEHKTAGTAEYTEFKGDDRKVRDEAIREAGFMTRAEEIRSGGKSKPEQDPTPPTFGTPTLAETLKYYEQHHSR